MRSNSSAKRTTVSSKSCRRHEVSPSARSTRVSIKSKDKNAHAQGACTPLDVVNCKREIADIILGGISPQPVTVWNQARWFALDQSL
jgi:hypothetical protein